MTDTSPDEERGTATPVGLPSVRSVAGTLAGIAPLVQGAWLVVGAALAYAALPLGPAAAGAATTTGQRVQATAGALGVLVLCGLISRLSGPLLRACAVGLTLLERRTEAVESLGHRLDAAVDRLASEHERAPARAGSPRSRPDPQSGIREAIRRADWSGADELIRAFREEHPDDPEGARLVEERDRARAEAARGLHAELDASRKVNDPDRALALRDALGPLIDPEALGSLDQELVRWLMVLIQKRLRTGTVRADVAELAARVSERFAHTMEGASLRASLPTLRRSAGLCARCGQPYQGIADACPTCLSTVSFPAFGSPDLADADENDEGDV